MAADKSILFLLLGILGIAFSRVWLTDLLRRGTRFQPTIWHHIVGFISDFLDTLGIGSFATTTAMYRCRKTVPDELIPGTLNVGHCLPTIAQAFIYITMIDVGIVTLTLTIFSAVLGAWLGAGVVVRWPRRWVQFGMGLALLAAGGLLALRLAHLIPSGGDSTSLHGASLAIAMIGNMFFGALMMVGVGAYAPIMIMVNLLGMNPKASFPIMMGACAFLMPTAGIRIIRAGAYDPRAALGLTLAGVPGVLLAAFIIKELPLDTIRWLVLAIVIYTAVSMLRAARREHLTPSVDLLCTAPLPSASSAVPDLEVEDTVSSTRPE